MPENQTCKNDLGNATLRAAQTGTDDGLADTSLLRENSPATDQQGIFRWSVDELFSS